MNLGAEKFPKIEPFAEVNDVDRLGKKAGLEMPDAEKLGLKAKDDNRLNLDGKKETLADSKIDN